MSMNDLQAKAKEIRELMRMKEELEAEITGLQDEIKGYMGDSEELITGEYKIRWSTVKSTRLDSTKLKAEHADLYSQYCKESVTRRFSIA